MGKSTKKSHKYLLAVPAVLLILPTLLFIALRLPPVQTYIVGRITKHLSGELTTHISTGRIEFRFFNRLIVNDILVRDQNNDTLLYSKQLRAGIRRIDPRNGNIRLGRIAVIEPRFALITDTSGQMNLNWLLSRLRKETDTIPGRKSSVSIQQIELNNAEFFLVNRNSEERTRGIDFARLHIDSLNAIVEDFRVADDTVAMDFYNMSFRESSGFSARAVKSTFRISGQNLFFNSVQVLTDSSVINVPRVYITTDSTGSLGRFTETARLDIVIDNSLVSTNDLRYFVPFFSKLEDVIGVRGRVAGTIAELRGRDLEFSYGDATSLALDFDFSGLPDLQNSFIYLGISSLTTNATDLRSVRLKGGKAIKIPPASDKLGTLSFSGSFTGFTTDFVAYGKLRSEYGTLNTDISLRPEENKRYRMKGLLTGTDIDMGSISGNSDLLGKINLRTEIDGYAYSLDRFGANIAGRIDSVEINRYLYRNISLDGFFTEKTWDGVVRVDDRNLSLDLLGMFSMKEKLPVFDFTLNITNANLPQLNIDKSDTASSLKMLITSDFRGNGIDNLDGSINLVNSRIVRYGDTLLMNDFTIRAKHENGMPSIALRTDYVDADVNGEYNFSSVGSEIRNHLSALMPSYFKAPDGGRGERRNNFRFRIDFKDTRRLNEFFRTKVYLASQSYISGSVIPDSIIDIEGKTSRLSLFNNSFADLEFLLKSSGSEFSFDMKSPALSLLKQPPLKDFRIGVKTVPDNFAFNMDWDNREKDRNSGSITARGGIERSSGGSMNPILRVTVDSTSIYTHSNLWKLSRSSFVVDSSSFGIDKLYLSNRNNYYLVDGKISENPEDTLRLAFKGIDISPMNYLLFQESADDPEAIRLNFRGRLNGDIAVSSVYDNLLVESDLVIAGLSFLESNYGDLSVTSAYDASQKVLDIDASNNLSGVKNLDISGYYDPVLKKTNIDISTLHLPVDALNPLLRIFASDISGTASGRVKLAGKPGLLTLNGAVMAENTKLRIDYLQTRYTLNDSIRFDNKGFRFNNVKLTDERGNPATLGGYVYHRNFKDFTPDLIINTNECQVLNTRPKDNELFYGTAYASGVTTIKSSPGLLSFGISAKTGRNTRFFIPLSSGMSVSEYSFVTFDDQNHGNTETGKRVPVAAPAQTGLELNFDLDVTPDAEAQLIFDSKAGDIMRGRGSGNLNIRLSKEGDFLINGDYIIEDGEYLFTLGNIMNKQFNVENGGKLMFNGNLDDAEIDLKAIYKLKASLYDIRLEEKYKERIPVECQLLLTGKLFNPLIGFNIYLPTADEETRSYLRNVVSTEEELSRQFLYLLVMNSFYSDPSFGSAVSSTPVSGTDAMKVTTYEMLSSQLSNWLSQISNDFDIGFVYRPGYNEINPQEVEVALSTQLLNDKVVINGNFDVRGTSQADNKTEQITGDFDAEIKITEKLRFKVFNRYNNPYTGKGVDYTQGIGVFFREDFDRLRDLFRRKPRPEAKKEDEPAAVEQKK